MAKIQRRKTCRKFTTRQSSIFLLLLTVICMFTFINYVMYQSEPGVKDSERIKQLILREDLREEKQASNVNNSGVIVAFTQQYDKCSYESDELQAFPKCNIKSEWMRSKWTSDPCYKENGVNGTECSILIYLGEIEKVCPRFKWRHLTTQPTLTETEPKRQKSTIRKNKQDLMTILDKAGGKKIAFLKSRIDRMWDTKWMPGVEVLVKKQEFKDGEQKRILIHLGLLTGNLLPMGKGGPLGELVQWSDIIASLYILGHDIEVSIDTKLLRHKHQTCPVGRPPNFDLIYTDIYGLRQIKKASASLWKNLWCKMRIIDSFGTDPSYNLNSYMVKTGRKTPWGGWDLHPLQFFTMFPHSPDNSFMGFVVENNKEVQFKVPTKRENKALVYGKMSYMWWKNADASTILDVINQTFVIHATVHIEDGNKDNAIPLYIHNHGIVSGSEIQQLLAETKLFIGLGFPYEGPAPLEAIANGCVFLNPAFSPPRNKFNTAFFEKKPNERELTSQNPYAEVFIGKPHVWTIDVTNATALKEAVKDISKSEPPTPYLPYEFQCEGMLQRLDAYISNQDFCNLPHSWPPKSAMQIRKSKLNQSCKEACMEDDLICEPTWFPHLNSRDILQKEFGMTCSSIKEAEDIYFPAINPKLKSCETQRQPLLFSCVGRNQDLKRICPCRTYIKGQVALCKECI